MNARNDDVEGPPGGTAPATSREAVDDRYAADILDSMSAHVAVLGSDGRIRQVNRAWRRFACDNTPGGCAPESTGLGVDYVAVCRAARGDMSLEGAPAADGIEDVLRGRRDAFELEYRCDSPTEERWFSMQVTPFSHPGAGAVVAHHDITARKVAELRVAAQSRHVELALSAAHLGVWSLDLATGRLEWSKEVAQIVGLREPLRHIDAWLPLLHPDDLGPMRKSFFEAVERRLPFTAEFRVVRPDGRVQWLANLARVECGADGEATGVVGTVEDITERKRTEWTLVAYNRILELVATGAGLRRTLEEVVRLVEELLPGALCSVLVVDPSAQRLRFGAGPSLPDEYNRAVDGVAIGPSAGSCGTAAHRKQTVAVDDIATDPLWRDYRELALRHGLRSCVSVPIFGGGDLPGLERGAVIGTFALYGRRPGPVAPLTYAVLSGAGRLAREAIETRGAEGSSAAAAQTAHVAEAASLAGMAIERDRAEHALREGEERFRDVLDSSPAAVCLEDLGGAFLFANRAAADLFGVPRAGWAGKRARDLLPAPVADVFDARRASVREAGRRVDERLTLRIAPGREVTVLATYFPLMRGSEVYAVCGILTDITALVSAQRELLQLWAHAPEPLCVARLDGRLEQLNPAWSRRLGWTEAELLARPWLDLVHPDDLGATEAALGRLAGGAPSERFEARLRCADGSYRWFSWDTIHAPGARAMYGFVRDVTEERRLADQVRQVQKMEAIGQLASGVAHDFNNLLTVINGECEILLEAMPRSDPHREPLLEVLSAGQRAAELTAQLLAFSRKAIVEPKVVDPNAVVESSTKILRRLIGEDIELETSLGPVPAIRVDPGQLEQVLINLAVNARDAMPTGGRLRIATGPADVAPGGRPEHAELAPGRYVELSLADDGAGMAPEVKAHVFEPFFTTKGVGKGTGLGLATVYGIVRQAGGAIWVDSEAGRGTAFHMLFPPARGAAVGSPPAPEVAPRGTETVLLVEDEAGVRKVAHAILAGHGYEVLDARNGDDAVRVAAAHAGPIHLLVTDVVMPGLGGRALVDRIRAARAAIRVLYMSGYTDDAVLRHGVEASQDQFVQKPFTPSTLARRVRETLDHAS
ncbi:MAG: PAS domain S-box protein [Polyangiales bacterium]